MTRPDCRTLNQQAIERSPCRRAKTAQSLTSRVASTSALERRTSTQRSIASRAWGCSLPSRSRSRLPRRPGGTSTTTGATNSAKSGSASSPTPPRPGSAAELLTRTPHGCDTQLWQLAPRPRSQEQCHSWWRRYGGQASRLSTGGATGAASEAAGAASTVVAASATGHLRRGIVLRVGEATTLTSTMTRGSY